MTTKRWALALVGGWWLAVAGAGASVLALGDAAAVTIAVMLVGLTTVVAAVAAVGVWLLVEP